MLLKILALSSIMDIVARTTYAVFPRLIHANDLGVQISLACIKYMHSLHCLHVVIELEGDTGMAGRQCDTG